MASTTTWRTRLAVARTVAPPWPQSNEQGPNEHGLRRFRMTLTNGPSSQLERSVELNYRNDQIPEILKLVVGSVAHNSKAAAAQLLRELADELESGD